MEELLRQILVGQEELRKELVSVKENMSTKTDIVQLENKMDTHFGSLYDVREVQADINERVCDSLNRIEKRLDRLSLRTSYNSAVIEKVVK